MSKAQCSQIDKGLRALQAHGTNQQREFATWLLGKNNLTTFSIGTIASIIVDKGGANGLIQRGNATSNEASKFITITLSPEQGDFSNDQGFNGTEIILAHEGRHAWVAADIITSFSNGDVSFDPTRYNDEFQANYSAALYLRERGGKYVDWGLKNDDGHLKMENGKIKVDSDSIRNKIAGNYKDDVTGGPLTQKHPGSRLSQIYGLTPKTEK